MERARKLGTPRAACLAAAFAALAPASVAGQLGSAEEPAGWPPVEIGARVGWDNAQRQEVLGALLRIPVLPSRVELLPSADVTFLRGLREYQFNAEAVYLLGEADGAIYAGGGIGFRNTIPPGDLASDRQTLTTWSIVVGLKLTNLERVNPMVEFRRVFASELVVDPQLLSIGATFELW